MSHGRILRALAAAAIVVAVIIGWRWYATREALRTVEAFRDRTVDNAEQQQARSAAAREAANLRATRALGFASGANASHLIIDRDPGALDQATPTLCGLARTGSATPLPDHPIQVSVGAPGKPSSPIGTITCPR
jgi:hypothetical protein